MSRLPDDEKWQPIDTAPKDGTKVDLWCKDYGRLCDVEWCGSSPINPSGHWVGDVLDFFHTDKSWFPATHWMHPPEPPECE